MKLLKKGGRIPSITNLVAVTNLLASYLPAELPMLRKHYPGKYSDSDFIAKLRWDAEQLLKLPPPNARIAARVHARLAMVDLKQQIMQASHQLSQNILEAYPYDYIPRQLSLAGISGNIKKVRRSNWPATERMIAGMAKFVNEEADFLIEKGLMSPSFLIHLENLRDEFRKQHALYGIGNGMSKYATEDVNAQAEALFRRISSILENIRLLVYCDKAHRDRYYFSTLLRTAMPSSDLGAIQVQLVDAVSSLPVAGATVAIPQINKSKQSTKNGRARLERLPDGVYTVQIEAPGHAPQTVSDVLVQKNCLKTPLKVALVPLQASEKAEPVEPLQLCAPPVFLVRRE